MWRNSGDSIVDTGLFGRFIDFTLDVIGYIFGWDEEDDDSEDIGEGWEEISEHEGSYEDYSDDVSSDSESEIDQDAEEIEGLSVERRSSDIDESTAEGYESDDSQQTVIVKGGNDIADDVFYEEDTCSVESDDNSQDKKEDEKPDTMLVEVNGETYHLEGDGNAYKVNEDEDAKNNPTSVPSADSLDQESNNTTQQNELAEMPTEEDARKKVSLFAGEPEGGWDFPTPEASDDDELAEEEKAEDHPAQGDDAKKEVAQQPSTATTMPGGGFDPITFGTEDVHANASITVDVTGIDAGLHKVGLPGEFS